MNAAEAIPDQPVGGSERVVALDFIRGIAVLGILFANIVALAQPTLAYYWPKGLPGGATDVDRYVWLFQFVLIDGKFRGLFTLLFGAGMILFHERVAARGAGLSLQPRRLFWLALFGLAHTFLVWTGDILLLFAVSGFAALAMLGWQARTQLRFGVVWFLSGSLLFCILLGSQAAMEGIPRLQEQRPDAYEQVRRGVAEQVEEAAEEAAVMRDGSYGEVVAYRVADEGPGLPPQLIFVALIETLPLMLIGMGLYRLGLFERRLDHARIRRWGWIGVLGGAALSLPLGLWVLVAGFPLWLTQFVFNAAAAFLHLPMILGLAALLSLWAPTASVTWLGSRVTAAGRMAFSNYLGTSLVMMLLFQGWAGGLYGEFHRAGLLLFVILGMALMLAWSKPWLARFRYGPLEWLWRCLTYGKRLPLRR